MAGISNSSSHRGEEKAFPQFWQSSGPVTNCMHDCSGSGAHVIPHRGNKQFTIKLQMVSHTDRHTQKMKT